MCMDISGSVMGNRPNSIVQSQFWVKFIFSPIYILLGLYIAWIMRDGQDDKNFLNSNKYAGHILIACGVLGLTQACFTKTEFLEAPDS